MVSFLMAKKMNKVEAPEDDDIPDGKKDEEGDEVIDLYGEEDDLAEDVIYDLSEIQDEMLTDETEDEEFGYEISDVEKMLRKMKCEPCPGSDSKKECKVRDDFGCPPGKESKKKPLTDAERRAWGKPKKKK
jgi:hypothetical protein